MRLWWWRYFWNVKDIIVCVCFSQTFLSLLAWLLKATLHKVDKHQIILQSVKNDLLYAINKLFFWIIMAHKMNDQINNLPTSKAIELCGNHLKGSWGSVTKNLFLRKVGYYAQNNDRHSAVFGCALPRWSFFANSMISFHFQNIGDKQI